MVYVKGHGNRVYVQLLSAGQV